MARLGACRVVGAWALCAAVPGSRAAGAASWSDYYMTLSGL